LIDRRLDNFPHVRADLRNAEQPRLVVNHPVKLRFAHLLGAPQKRNQSRVEIAGTGAHHQTRRRREAHARVHAFAIAHGGHAGAVAQMSEDDAPGRRLRASDRFEFVHQKE
jgi:hypothetical protein